MFKENANASGFGDRGAAKHNTMVGQKNRVIGAQRRSHGIALFHSLDQSNVRVMARHLDEVTGLESKREQLVVEAGHDAAVEWMTVERNVDLRAAAQDLAVDRPFGMAAAEPESLFPATSTSTESSGPQFSPSPAAFRFIQKPWPRASRNAACPKVKSPWPSNSRMRHARDSPFSSTSGR